MTLDSLKAGWQQLPHQSASEARIFRQIETKKKEVFATVRRKLLMIPIIIAAGYVAWEAFDLAQRPVEGILLVAFAAALMVVNTLLFYSNSRIAKNGSNLLGSLHGMRRQFALQSYLQPLIVGLLHTCWLYAMLSTIVWTTSKYWILAGISVTLIVMLYFSFTYWRKKERVITEMIYSLQAD